MPERDGYIPGVPCWVDTSQPDPDAAVDFYGGLFGWEFEDVMPAGTRGAKYLDRPDPRRRRRRRRLAARGRRRPAALEHLRLGRERRRDRGQGPRRRRQRADGAVRRHGRRAGWPSSPIPRARRSASGRRSEHKGAQIVNEHGVGELQRPQHPRPRGREGVLRRGLRLGGPRPRRRRRDVDPARLRRPPRGASTPGCARAWPRWARPRASRTWSPASSRSPTTSPTRPPHWSVTFAVDDADASAAEGQGARRPGDRRAVRRAVGADDRDRRSRRARRSSPASSCPRTRTSARRSGAEALVAVVHAGAPVR